MSTTAPLTRPGPAGRSRRLPGLSVALGLLLSLLMVTGCSAADLGAPAPQDAAPRDAASQLESGADAAGSDDGGGESGTDAGSVDVGAGDPMMVRSVRLQVVVEDVSAAVSRARAAATGAGGWVSSEEVSPATDDRAGWATIVLRVPSEDLDAVVTELGELGEVGSIRSEAEDVTVEYRDVEARVSTLEASAERLRELVGEATGVEAIASLERELADREAELDALKARMKVLADDVARSTISLHLAEDSEDLSGTGSGSGFVAGVKQGWEAFLSSVTVLLTALGALLPFLAVAAVVLVPLLLLRRRRARSRTTGLASPGDRQADAAGNPDRA